MPNRINVAWAYVPLLSPEPAEFDPVVHIYPSATVENATPRIQIVDSTLDTAFRSALDAAAATLPELDRESGREPIPRKWLDHSLFMSTTFTYTGQLPADATLNVDAFARTYNKKGQLCLNEAGSASVYLLDVAKALENEPKGHSLVIQRALRVYAADGLLKGVILFLFDSGAVGTPVLGLNIALPTARDYYGENNKRIFDQSFDRYAQISQQILMTELQPSWPGVRNIRMPGYAFRGLDAPSLAFILPIDGHQARSGEPYYKNLLDVALRRHYKYARSLEDAREAFSIADPSESAVVLATMACVFSNYCNYMTDKAHTLHSYRRAYGDAAGVFEFIPATQHDPEHTDRVHAAHHARMAEHLARVGEDVARQANANVKLVESFSAWLRSTGTGDCEDLAREIFFHLWDIKASAFKDPLLQRVARIRNHYATAQTLKGVTSGAITDAQLMEKLGAHMDITLFPWSYLLDLLAQFNTAAPLFDPLPEAASIALSDREIHNASLPVLICEGTGCLQPDGAKDPDLASKLYVIQHAKEAFADVKTVLHQPLRESSVFYKTTQSALVHEFLAEGYGLAELVFVQQQPVDINATLDEFHTCEQLAARIGEEAAVKQVYGDDTIENIQSISRRVNTYAALGKKPTYGILHTDMVQKRTTGIAIYSMPDLTRDEMDKIHRVLAHSHPSTPLTPGKMSTKTNGLAALAARVPTEKRIAALAAKSDSVFAGALRAATLQNGGGPVPLIPGVSPTSLQARSLDSLALAYVDFYFRYDQLEDDPARMRALERVVDTKENILAVHWYEENVAAENRVGGYLVRFVVVRMHLQE